VPPEDWPVQGPIAGADIKSKGFIPWPGSEHYSGERYELTGFGRGPAVVPAWPELMAAILADRGAHHRSGGPGGNGGGHDGELAAEVLRMILRGWDKETCYQMWCTIATPHDLAWPYERADFERHHRGAARKTQEITEQNAQVMATWRAHMDRYAGGVR
jgi:hypothetical protein